VCVLDAVKSDWWGLTSSADGKREGLPFQILGGPRGHVPVTSSAGTVVGKLVGRGDLPHSIIDMADFEPGGLQRFFIDFSQALMKNARGVVYLVIEEAHEFAPKERAGIGNENLAIHMAKKLATAGRSKGIRLIVATQRTQALHNAILGSCETIIAHRLTAPADQQPILKWLKANTDKNTEKAVADSLSSLPTGTGWVCSGEAQVFEQVKFPLFSTFDNTATPSSDGAEIRVKTAAVDSDALRELIGTAVAEAEADDPKKLRERIKELEAAKPEPVDVEAIEQEYFKQGFAAGRIDGQKKVGQRLLAFVTEIIADMELPAVAEGDPQAMGRPYEPVSGTTPEMRGVKPPKAKSVERVSSVRPIGESPTWNPSPSLTGPQIRILGSLVTWEQLGFTEPSSVQVAWLAGYSPKSSAYQNTRSSLKTQGLVEYRSPGTFSLSDEGRSAAEPVKVADATVLDYVLSRLSGPEQRILRAVASFYPNAAEMETAANAAGYSHTSSAFQNNRSALRTKGLITYPVPGALLAVDWLFTRIN
jgi:hypothetical protein